MQGHNQQALNAFNQLDNDHLSEDELIQMSVLEIELNLFQQAEVSLKKLADLAPSYLPKYATILKLNNKVAEAENIYLIYLEQHSHDIKAWLALANIYLANNSLQSAAEAFKNIQTLDPNNIEAQHFFNSTR